MPPAAALAAQVVADVATEARPSSTEERFTRAGLSLVERRPLRRSIALALAVSPEAGAVARRSADVHAELRRVLGSDSPRRA